MELEEDRFFRMNFATCHLQYISIGGKTHSTFRIGKGVEQMAPTMVPKQVVKKSFNFSNNIKWQT